MSMSHGGANGFYFQDTMLLQSFWSCQREERGRARKGEQHMISTWGCRNSDFISGTHWRNQTVERETETERVRVGGRESPKGKGESEKWRKRNRGREREKVKKGSPKKDRVRELRLHVAVEGMVWIWRGTSSQVRLSCGTLQASLFIFFSVIGCIVVPEPASAPKPPPPSGIFHSLILSRLLTACFPWVLDLELGALQGLCSSLSAVLVYPSLSALWAFFFSFVSPSLIPPLSNCFFVLKCCCSPLSTFLFKPISTPSEGSTHKRL